MKTWLDALDDEEFREAERMLLGDDAALSQNFSELLIGAWLRELGQTYTRHSPASNGKKPDFAVLVDGQRLHIEVVTTTGYSRGSATPGNSGVDQDARYRTDRFEAVLVEELDRGLQDIGPSRWMLSLTVEGTLRSGSDPATGPIVHELVRWVRDDLPKHIHRSDGDGDGDEESRRRVVPLREHHARVILEADAEANEPLGYPSLWLYGWTPSEAQRGVPLNPARVLCNTLRRKAVRYGTEAPLLIAMCLPEVNEWIRWPDDPLVALYGTGRSRVLVSPSGERCILTDLSTDGLWCNAPLPHVGGVLMVANTSPQRFSNIEAFWAPNPAYAGPPVPDWFDAAGRVEMDPSRGKPHVVSAARGSFRTACGAR